MPFRIAARQFGELSSDGQIGSIYVFCFLSVKSAHVSPDDLAAKCLEAMLVTKHPTVNKH